MSEQQYQLRNRRAMSNSTPSNSNDDILTTRTGAGLSANRMIAASPSHQGKVHKLQIPLLFSVLPAFLQRIICSYSILSFLAPKWKERYLIQIGNYVYRFSSPNSSTPKGSPVALEMITDVQLFTSQSSSHDGVEFVSTPPSVGAIFCISTYGKRQYYGVSTRDEAFTWINSLQEGKQEATRRSMGHADSMPYSKQWQYFDNLGANFVKSKDRIKNKIVETETREMEMTTFGERGAIPRGYYG